MEQPATQYAYNGRLHIAYQVFGEGAHDLVLVPAFITNVELWWDWPEVVRFYRRLAAFSRVIIFDRQGVGLSDPARPGATFEDWLDDLRSVMDAVDSERAALYGAADGGAVATLFAATYPERTAALILYGSYARRTWAPDYPWAPEEDFHKRAFEIYEQKWGREPVGLGSAAPSLAHDQRFREIYVRGQRFSASPGAAADWYRIASEIDIRNVLASVSVPTLVLHRKGDRAVDIENGRYLAEHIPSAQFVELEGEDHFVFAGDVDAVTDEIAKFVTGSPSPVEADRVLATVMYSDIASSSERATELGDRSYRELLDQHDAITQGEVERFRGKVIKNRGDGFLAMFDGPTRAIRCALSLVEAIRGLGVEIRAGLHSGECELRGDDIGGIAANIGARVLEMAGPGEVWVSSTVKDLSIGSGIAFSDRGTHALKGIPGEWHLFEALPTSGK